MSKTLSENASRGEHFRQILILLEKFLNHLDDWFRSLFMCLELSNTFKHIFPKDIAYSILESSKMTEKAEKNQNFQVSMFTYFLVTKMIMMFSICSKLKKNSFCTSIDTIMADFFRLYPPKKFWASNSQQQQFCSLFRLFFGELAYMRSDLWH